MGVLCIVILIGLRMLKDSKGNANTTASKIIWLLGTGACAPITPSTDFSTSNRSVLLANQHATLLLR